MGRIGGNFLGLFCFVLWDDRKSGWRSTGYHGHVAAYWLHR